MYFLPLSLGRWEIVWSFCSDWLGWDSNPRTVDVSRAYNVGKFRCFLCFNLLHTQPKVLLFRNKYDTTVCYGVVVVLFHNEKCKVEVDSV